MVVFTPSHQDPSSTVLNILQLLKGFSSSPNERCIAEVQQFCYQHSRLLMQKILTEVEEGSVKVQKLNAVWGAAALVPALLLSILTAVLCIKRKRAAERDTDIQSISMPGDDTYTALNHMTMSPDYDTLQNVQHTASDTYATLNPATMSSDYDTLQK
ncbi:uncharacterized protein Hap1MRO34_004789 [Clarias gariepinus]